MTLGERMRSWRRAAGLSTKEAGDRLGLSPRTIEGIEQGRAFRHPLILELALERLDAGTATRQDKAGSR